MYYLEKKYYLRFIIEGIVGCYGIFLCVSNIHEVPEAKRDHNVFQNDFSRCYFRT